MKQIKDSISTNELKEMSKKMFGGLVKAVVDIKREIIMVDAAMHADEEKGLLEDGSAQVDLWGINFYPDLYDSEDFVEFDSMINIRPNQGNRSRGVDDTAIQQKILNIVSRLVTK